jgi:hypothetical protein
VQYNRFNSNFCPLTSKESQALILEFLGEAFLIGSPRPIMVFIHSNIFYFQVLDFNWRMKKQCLKEALMSELPNLIQIVDDLPLCGMCDTVLENILLLAEVQGIHPRHGLCTWACVRQFWLTISILQDCKQCCGLKISGWKRTGLHKNGGTDKPENPYMGGKWQQLPPLKPSPAGVLVQQGNLPRMPCAGRSFTLEEDITGAVSEGTPLATKVCFLSTRVFIQGRGLRNAANVVKPTV